MSGHVLGANLTSLLSQLDRLGGIWIITIFIGIVDQQVGPGNVAVIVLWTLLNELFYCVQSCLFFTLEEPPGSAPEVGESTQEAAWSQVREVCGVSLTMTDVDPDLTRHKPARSAANSRWQPSKRKPVMYGRFDVFRKNNSRI